jgi:hypothetical protein
MQIKMQVKLVERILRSSNGVSQYKHLTKPVNNSGEIEDG